MNHNCRQAWRAMKMLGCLRTIQAAADQVLATAQPIAASHEPKAVEYAVPAEDIAELREAVLSVKTIMGDK